MKFKEEAKKRRNRSVSKDRQTKREKVSESEEEPPVKLVAKEDEIKVGFLFIK